MCRDIAIEHLLWYFLYCTISMNVFSSEGTVQVFKKSRCVPGCYGSLDGASACKPKGSPVGFPVRTHAWQEKICGACGEDAVTDGMCQKWIVKFHSGDLSQG